MINEIISCLLGVFVGGFAALIGTTSGSALMLYMLLYLKIIPNVTALTGTLLFISCMPLGLFGVYEYYKHKKIDFYIGTIIAIGIIIGMMVGSRYSFIMNDTFGEKNSDKVKFGITAVSFLILACLYMYKVIYE